MQTQYLELCEGGLAYTDLGGSGKLELFDGTGHYPQSERPEKTVPIVIDFLRNSTN